MLRLNVPDMSCGHCQATVTDALMDIDRNAQIDVDLANRQVSVQSSASTQTVIAALEKAGYPASEVAG